MNLQVNLLHSDEVRSTSRVSKSFMIQVGSALVLVLLVGWLLGMLWKQSSLTRQKERLTAQYEELKPRQERVTLLLDDLKWQEGLMAELTGWKSSAINWHEELEGLLTVVPSNIQLVSMDVSGPLRVTYEKKVSQCNRQYSVDLVGIAKGAQSDDAVLRFKRALPKTNYLADHWESCKLNGIQNQTSGGTDSAVLGRRFDLDVTLKKRVW